MLITCEWDGREYMSDLSRPVSIAITLQPGPAQPNAFAAPPFTVTPVRDGDFIGAIAQGGPVNFFNIEVNPHGNGTHTECVGHIVDGDYSIDKLLRNTLLVAELVSVFPTINESGDRVITDTSLVALSTTGSPALIVRTLPNETDKTTRHYTGTNPPYFSPDAMRWIRNRGVEHLLTDLPSVDPEHDGGALTAHKIFWDVPENPESGKTITEMVFVDNNVEDGLYLLTIQIAPLALDVSPSRPLLFRMKPIS
ncbi:MAG: cyclase family protein [Saprospiraceae bacterium]|nr:cyclase family protein [Saprospiraceae bacterium]